MYDEREGRSRLPWHDEASPARSAWSALRRQALRDRAQVPEQVINRNVPPSALPPVSEVPVERVRSGWAATLPGGSVPLIWDREARGG